MDPIRDSDLTESRARRADPASRHGNALRPVPPVSRPAQPSAADGADGEIDLREYLAIISDARWLVAGIALACMLVGGAYAFLSQPIYKSDVVLQVEEKSAGPGGLEELSSMFGTQSPAEAEIEIIRSRALVGQVAEELRLDVSAQPIRFPVVGGAMARRYKGLQPASAPLGLGSYAWGGERIKVQRLEVPEILLDEELVLTAGEGGRFELKGPEGDLLVAGGAGSAATQGEVSLFVDELVARPGTRFRLVKHRFGSAVAQLREDMRVAERGKKTGIILVALEGPDRNLVARTLDTVAAHYLRQNVERKSEEASKTLAFLDEQLPELRRQVEAAESALNAYRSKRGSVDLTLEAQAALQRSVEIEKRISELQVQREDLRRRFTDTHPLLVAAERQLKELQGSRRDVEGVLKGLPQSELQSARLMRDAKVSTELYTLLLNKAQELRLIRSGTVGNVRIIDRAVINDRPDRPKKGILVVASLFLGLFLGAAVALVRKTLSPGMEDPEEIERVTGLNIYASIPHSAIQTNRDRLDQRSRSRVTPILAEQDPSEPAIESIRSLRTSLQFALLEASNNAITITGPSPGIGKSFVAVNLAKVMADGGSRVLLVDADMRRGKLNRNFGIERAPGLTEVLRGEAEMSAVIRFAKDGNLAFLPSGTIPANPSEMLSSERFRQLFTLLCTQYDLVIYDAPPILAVTDAALIGRLSSMSLMVLRSARHPVREVNMALRTLQHNGVNPSGLILNDVAIGTGRGGGRFSYHYQYDYR